jgi:hypothetical protein
VGAKHGAGEPRTAILPPDLTSRKWKTGVAATKNPARWGSKGGANQEVGASHRALGESYHRIRTEPSSDLKFNESCRSSFPGT